MSRSARILLPLILVAAGTAALWRRFNAPPGAVGAEFPFDLVFYYLPMMEQAAERLRAGEIPLWNPYNGCGVPLLATAQVGVLYPGNWPAVFLPVEQFIPVRMFVECLLGGLFTAGFLQSLGIRPAAAGLGGVLFVFACMIGQTLWPPQVAAIAWMPLGFWSVERFLQTGRRRWAVLFTAALAMQILAGYPQFLVYTLYLLGPYALMRMAELARAGTGNAQKTHVRDPAGASGERRGCQAGGGAGGRREICGAAAAAADAVAGRAGADGRKHATGLRLAAARGLVLLGSALAAVLLTAAQWLPTLELVGQTARREPLRPEEVHYLETERGVKPSLARLLANAVNPKPKFTALDHPDGAGYLGLAAGPLIVLAVVSGRRRPVTWFMLAGAAAFLLLSLGHFGPLPRLYELYSALPGGGMFRTPGRMRLAGFFCLIALVAMGLDRLCAWTERRPGRGSARRAAGIGLAAAMAADVVHATGRYGSLRDVPSAWTRCFHVDGCRVIDAARFKAVAARAGIDRIAMVGMLPPKPTRPLSRALFLSDYEPLTPSRWIRASAAMGGRAGRTMLDVDPDRYPLIYDLAGVRYVHTVVVSEAFRARHQAWSDCYGAVSPRPQTEDLLVNERVNQDALPRACLLWRYEVCTFEEALDRIVRSDFDPRGVVLLEEPPPAGLTIGESSAGEQAGEVRVTKYEAHEVVVRVRTPSAALLVLSDSWYPGWEAAVDGRPTPILRANGLFRAVGVPAGRHEIVFSYRPWSWRAGVLLTVAAAPPVLLVTLAAGGRPVASRRRPG